MQAAIDFDSLGLSPVLFEIGPFALRWYSLSYIAGILLAWWYIGKLIDRGAKDREGAPLTRLHADALITWATLGVIIGGRTAYVIFYDWPKFAADPWAILRLWEGGMAFHGGALGVIVAVVLFCRLNKLDWLRVHDYVVCTVPIGLFLGRLANFVNGELWGRPTGSDWGVIFRATGDELPRHPSQLYEAGLEGLVLFGILWWLFWRTDARARPGLLSGVFLLGYGVFRFLVEYVRDPDPQIGLLATGLTMGQTLCLPMIAIGGWLIVTSGGRARRAVAAG